MNMDGFGICWSCYNILEAHNDIISVFIWQLLEVFKNKWQNRKATKKERRKKKKKNGNKMRFDIFADFFRGGGGIFMAELWIRIDTFPGKL